MNQLQIEAPDNFENDEEFIDWVLENSELFHGAMDLDASIHDDRATVDEVRITNVELDDASVAIYYEYDYSAYYGCRNIDHGDTSEEEVIVGKRKGHNLLFDKFKPREKRSTDEEL